jgi:hypothetical protein
VDWLAHVDAAASRVRAGAGRLTLCGLAVASLGLGVLWTFGQLSHLALLLVLVASVLAIGALRGGRWRQGRGWWVAITVVCGLTDLLYAHHFHLNPALQVGFALLLTASAAGAAWAPPGRRAAALLGVAGLSLLGLTASDWPWGSAGVDVFTALQGSAESLLHLHNPYGPVFRYYVESSTGYVWGHFAYGPSVPILAAIGRLVGDVRVMSVVCVAAIVAALWHLAWQGEMRSDAHRVAALALASPLMVGMIHESWVDVYMMAGIAGWLALRRGHRRWSMVVLAAGLMVKFTSLVLIAPAFLWLRRGRVEIVVAVVISVAVIVPFALMTGVGTFVYSVFGYQLALPFRTDSLNLSAELFRVTQLQLPTAFPFVPLALAAALIVWRGRPRTEGDLALQAAILNILAFILAKQAFFNYYFASEVMLLAAMAGAGVALPEGDVTRPAAVAALVGEARRLLGNRTAPRRTPTATPTAVRLTPPPTRKASWVPPTELSHPARRPPSGAGTPVKMYP